MPKFETSVELLDPMAEVQKESEVEKEKPAENSTDENAALLTKLLSNPETAALLKALAKTIQSYKKGNPSGLPFVMPEKP